MQPLYFIKSFIFFKMIRRMDKQTYNNRIEYDYEPTYKTNQQGN
jgi:hypothetical protein